MNTNYMAIIKDKSTVIKGNQDLKNHIISKQIIPETFYVTENSESDIDVDEQGAIVIDVADDNNPLEINCVCDDWQITNTEAEEWEFEDIESKDNVINYLLEGSRSELYIDKQDLGLKDDLNHIRYLIELFNERNQQLLNIG